MFLTLSTIFILTIQTSLENQQLYAVEKYRNEASQQLDRWLDGRRYSIKNNSRYLEEIGEEKLKSSNIERIIEDQVQWDDNIIDILIIDKDGFIVNSIGGSSDINLASRQYYKDGIAGKSNVTGIYKSVKSGSLIMAVGEPLIFDNGNKYVVVGVISVNRVKEVVESLTFGDWGHAYLVNGEKQLVTDSQYIQEYINNIKDSNINKELINSFAIEEISKQKEGTSSYLDFAGQKVFGSYKWLDDLDVGLVVEFNYNKVMGPIQTLLWIVLILSIIVIIAGFIISYSLSKRLINPINKLIDATTEISAQNNDITVEIKTGTELDKLVKSFNHMSKVIYSRELELKRKNEELRIQRAEAIEANKLKSQFLANMSHELRTPLNSIIGFTTRVIKKSEDILPKVQRENLQIVKDEAQHLLEIINGLLDYSKIEAGKMEVHIESFTIKKVIDEVYKIANTLIDNKHINFVEEYLIDENIIITSDRLKLKQILINLISNAFKYSDEGTVKVTINKVNNFYTISVSDEGIGISQENLNNIFDEFRQIDGSYTRKVGGTGLGLSITKKFVELLSGKIEVSSKLGSGSTFTVYLPVDVKVEKKQYSEEENEEQERKDFSKKVVCIDDDPNVHRLYKQYLKSEGFELIILNGQEDILLRLIDEDPDVILLDILLPHKDGWEILSEIRSNNRLKKKPVIMISVLSEKNLAYKMEADEYLIKPVAQEELLYAINNIIDNKDNIDILIADDDEISLNLIGQFLDEEGISYRTAKDGYETIKKIYEKKTDLLVLDIMMPGKDGFTVLDEVRKNETLNHMHIIVVTAKDLTKKEREELNRRANTIIHKSGSYVEDIMKILIDGIKDKTAK